LTIKTIYFSRYLPLTVNNGALKNFKFDSKYWFRKSNNNNREDNNIVNTYFIEALDYLQSSIVLLALQIVIDDIFN